MVKEIIKKNKGFVILFAVTLSALLLSIALGVANVAFREAKFNTSAKDTNNAFFAADTGAECALYYDKSTMSVFATQTSPPPSSPPPSFPSSGPQPQPQPTPVLLCNNI